MSIKLRVVPNCGHTVTGKSESTIHCKTDAWPTFPALSTAHHLMVTRVPSGKSTGRLLVFDVT